MKEPASPSRCLDLRGGLILTCVQLDIFHGLCSKTPSPLLRPLPREHHTTSTELHEPLDRRRPSGILGGEWNDVCSRYSPRMLASFHRTIECPPCSSLPNRDRLQQEVTVLAPHTIPTLERSLVTSLILTLPRFLRRQLVLGGLGVLGVRRGLR